MKSLCNRRVSGWNPDTLKEIVRFVHEVHPVFAVTLSTFLHMLCGWNDDAMPIFNLFTVYLKCFSISGSFSSTKSVNAWKITNEVRKGWKLTRSRLNGPFWTQKKSGVQISSKRLKVSVSFQNIKSKKNFLRIYATKSKRNQLKIFYKPLVFLKLKLYKIYATKII